VHDLLTEMRQGMPSRNLLIREDKTQGVQVVGLREQKVASEFECAKLLSAGVQRRETDATRGNEHSSRSHAVFQLIARSLESGRSKLSLADLAGSERMGPYEQGSKVHIQELKNINLSLMTLGRVIYKLATGST